MANPEDTAPIRGILVIVSSPSGAGKTTLARRLLAEFSALHFSVSYTTRPPRKNEVDGVDYCFVDDARFQQMVDDGAFAEWAVVHGNRYGTSRAAVERALSSGDDVVFDVDWQGAAALSAQWPDDALKIFVLPPDLPTLANRLRRRATDAEEIIQRRLRKALEELRHHGDYEHIIVNEALDAAYAVLRAIYLVRRYGPVDRADVAHPLARLAAEIAANQAAGGAARAERLIAEGE